jgi:hypothetical protein
MLGMVACEDSGTVAEDKRSHAANLFGALQRPMLARHCCVLIALPVHRNVCGRRPRHGALRVHAGPPQRREPQDRRAQQRPRAVCPFVVVHPLKGGRAHLKG